MPGPKATFTEEERRARQAARMRARRAEGLTRRAKHSAAETEANRLRRKAKRDANRAAGLTYDGRPRQSSPAVVAQSGAPEEAE